MTTPTQFLAMTFVRSRIQEDDNGDLVRIETRKDDRTGLTLTRTSKVPASKEYLAATE